MEQNPESRFSYRHGETTIEFAGPTEFVIQQLHSFEKVITAINEQVIATCLPSKSTPRNGAPTPAAEGDLGSYSRLFAIANEKVKILKALPGTKKADKTVSAALLCLYANELRGSADVPYETIRDLCKDQSCLDSSNFSGTLKGAREHLIVEGVSGSRNQTVKLTIPGREKAKQLADDLNAQ